MIFSFFSCSSTGVISSIYLFSSLASLLFKKLLSRTRFSSSCSRFQVFCKLFNFFVADGRKPARHAFIREFKKVRRQLQRKLNVTLKLKFAFSQVFCFYSRLVTLYKIGGMHFCLLGTNGFHVKAKNERVTAASSRFRQNLKYENFTSSFARLRQNIVPNIVSQVQHDYFSSFNQSNQ